MNQAINDPSSGDGPTGFVLPPIAQVPALWTFASLAIGLGGGLALALAAPQALPLVLMVSEPIGDLWLRALQATIVPLVAALLFTGTVQVVATANAGALARRSLGMFLAVLGLSAATALTLTPFLLTLLPIPGEAGAALRATLAAPPSGPLPGMAEYLRAIVPTNVIDAAANDRMLPMILFVAIFALASTKIERRQRDVLATFFAAIASAMLVVIGWVLAAAPIGVLALSLTVAGKTGSAAIGALARLCAGRDPHRLCRAADRLSGCRAAGPAFAACLCPGDGAGAGLRAFDPVLAGFAAGYAGGLQQSLRCDPPRQSS